jgi:putative peptidoglycan lipid II flippase
MVLHVVLCLLLMSPMGVGGLALATSISAYFNLALMAFLIKKKIGSLDVQAILPSAAKSASAAAFAAFTAWVIVDAAPFGLFINALFAILAASGLFLACAKALKSEELNLALGIFKR